MFLDFDGVLSSVANGYRGLDPSNVARLNVLCESTGATVVVTSTWRRGGLMSCRTLLRAAGFTGRVFQCTPIIEMRQPSGLYLTVTRGQEIQAWLDGCGDRVERFVILDDDKDMGELAPYLVRTDPAVGLMDADLERAVDVLGGKVQLPA